MIKRLRSLYRNMKDAMMSPRWEGILWGGKKKRHQYSIVYNTSERAMLHDCEKRSSGNVCSFAARILSVDLLIDNITATQTHPREDRPD